MQSYEGAIGGAIPLECRRIRSKLFTPLAKLVVTSFRLDSTGIYFKITSCLGGQFEAALVRMRRGRTGNDPKVVDVNQTDDPKTWDYVSIDRVFYISKGWAKIRRLLSSLLENQPDLDAALLSLVQGYRRFMRGHILVPDEVASWMLGPTRGSPTLSNEEATSGAKKVASKPFGPCPPPGMQPIPMLWERVSLQEILEKSGSARYTPSEAPKRTFKRGHTKAARKRVSARPRVYQAGIPPVAIPLN